MSTTLLIRLSEAEKVAIRSAALDAGKTTTDYILDILAAHAGFERVERLPGRQFSKDDIVELLTIASRYCDAITQEYYGAEYERSDGHASVLEFGDQQFSEKVLQHCFDQCYLDYDVVKDVKGAIKAEYFRLTADGEQWLFNNT